MSLKKETVIYPTYEHYWVYLIPYKYVGHNCEGVKI